MNLKHHIFCNFAIVERTKEKPCKQCNSLEKKFPLTGEETRDEIEQKIKDKWPDTRIIKR